MAAISTPKTGDQALDLFHSRLKSEIDPLLANKLMQGNLVENVLLVPGQNQVSHTLQRIPYGYIVVQSNSLPQVYNFKTSDKNYLYLNSSTSVLVSLWTF